VRGSFGIRGPVFELLLELGDDVSYEEKDRPSLPATMTIRAEPSMPTVVDQVRVYVAELRDFHGALRTLDAELTGSATLGLYISNVSIQATLEAGSGSIEGILYRRHYELKFRDFDTDQTFIRRTLAEVERVLSTL
jgi:hypothetical protein